MEIVRKKVCLISDHHLCINPRVWKEAFVYEKMGYKVTVLTMWQSKELLQRDAALLKGHRIDYKAYLNLIPGEINGLLRFFYRFRRRMACELQRRWKISTPWAISHAPELLVKKAIEERAHHYSAHLETAFWAGRELIQRGKQVSFDFEDWYSRDYLTADRAVELLAAAEAYAVKRGVFCTAASASMALALQETYQPAKPITTIYNSFPDEELEGVDTIRKATDANKIRLVWTSRTVGPHRGLETLLEALPLVRTPLELHIIGKCAEGYETFVKNHWPHAQHKLVFHDFIPHAQLLPTIASFDMGLAIEQYEPDSRNTTVTNKILQYLHAGLAVLATDTKGQQEIAAHFSSSVFLVKANDPQQWAQQIELFLQQRSSINQREQEQIYQQFFSWQVQEQQLQQLISQHL
ncbi:MAG TPA: glycosyltransferase [Lacibacter sp.]|nr:glycosyltransferase [Lacibacter sp.]